MKILIVDDEEISRTILLSKMADMGTCVAVNSAKAALAELDNAKSENNHLMSSLLMCPCPAWAARNFLNTYGKKRFRTKSQKPTG